MQDFIEYITRSAAEGETVLLVKQKPKLKDGELQHYKDGAVVCTWPAFLPSKWKAGGSWYANTGCFLLSHFKDGRVSASRNYCDHVAFLILDDICTKSIEPPAKLLPTWIIETSPKNYQWGFTFRFDEQPTKEAYSSAIRAIADAGYTDKGAINPVRNFRIPGSVNIKPGRNNFEAKLVGLWPEREYSLTEICAALGVTPGISGNPGISGHIDDTGSDDVVQWLHDTGRILEGRNPEGWYGVQCPNAAEHSDGNPMGRYLPVNRAYVCFHSHCGDWNSTRFLQWVEAEGGPAHETGLRADVFVGVMQQAISAIQAEAPPTVFSELASAETVLAQVDARQQDRVDKLKWYERFAYVIPDDSFFDMVERTEVPRSSFNALFRHVPCNTIHGGRRIEAATCFDENRQAKGAKVLLGVTYAAGETVLVANEGQVYGNKWSDARPAIVKGHANIKQWHSLAERLIPVDGEREHIFNMLACKVQFPRIKINHALLHAGVTRGGKDSLYDPFFWAIGGAAHRNISLVRNEALATQWGYDLEAEVMRINELRQAEAKDRRAMENSLKPVIAAPPDYLPVNRKGMHPYMALNRIFVIAFSNERAAISLAYDDQRWFVVWSGDCGVLPQDIAIPLWSWYNKGNGRNEVASWLYERDISKFQPGAAPPMTDAKAVMLERGRTAPEEFVMELIRERKFDFAKGVIASPFGPLCDRLSMVAPVGTKVTLTLLYQTLRDSLWVDHGLVASKDHPTKKQIFVAPEIGKLTKTALRALEEEPLQTSRTRVK